MEASASSVAFSWHSVYATLVASVRSVGTAVTLASVGVYLHRRRFIQGEGKRTLALISQQVTFPLFLFTKIIYCNQDWSDNPCPDIAKSLDDVWLLLFWPIYTVGTGFLVGWLVCWCCQTPIMHVKAVLAACGFGNSTGLPITLLMVVHANFPSTSDLGRIDPTLFLSVYLLLYPVLQWGIGGWLLAPEELSAKANPSLEQTLPLTAANSPPKRLLDNNISPTASNSMRNVLNNTEASDYYTQYRRGLTSNDEGLYMSEVDLAGMARQSIEEQRQQDAMAVDPDISNKTNSTMLLTVDESESDDETGVHGGNIIIPHYSATTNVPPKTIMRRESSTETDAFLPKTETRSMRPDEKQILAPWWTTLQHIAERCFQPPAVGALLGIFVALLPRLRGTFVDIVGRSGNAPLQWMFDGLHSVGLAAVPVNMMILGCNLDAAQWRPDKILPDAMPYSTMLGIVIGKMLVLPIIGIASSLFLREYVLNIPEDIDGAFYLVVMIVFLCPTASKCTCVTIFANVFCFATKRVTYMYRYSLIRQCNGHG
jgi:predicted permease